MSATVASPSGSRTTASARTTWPACARSSASPDESHNASPDKSQNASPDASLMSTPSTELDGVRACLVDVYETLLAYDFERHSRDMAARAGADLEQWRRAQVAILPDFDSGRLTMTAAIERILTECGIAPRPDLADELARADGETLAEG